MVCESFVPKKEQRELGQLARTRIDLVAKRTMFKNKVHAILAKYEFYCPVKGIFSKEGRN